MPFLAPLIPAAIGAAAAAGGGALAKAAIGAISGGSGNDSGFRAQQANVDKVVNQDMAANSIQGAQSGISQQQQFLDALQQQQGISNQSKVFNQQQALADQLGLMAQGGGPNPAMAQLANTTGQNIASQASLMASQRGASANPALLARQAAMQGGNIQQQAAGQAAALNAQQQLNAIGALQNQQNMLGGLATQQVGQQASGLNNLNSVLQNQQGAMLNQINAQNQANIQNASQANSANAGIAQGNMKSTQDLAGGISKGLGDSAAAMFGSSDKQKKMAHGGLTSPSQYKSKAVSHLMMAQGGSVGQKLREGGMVPGKAKVSGDSLKNDTVHAKLSPDEIVIPRSIVLSDDPVNNAAKFVAAILAKEQGLKKGKK